MIWLLLYGSGLIVWFFLVWRKQSSSISWGSSDEFGDIAGTIFLAFTSSLMWPIFLFGIVLVRSVQWGHYYNQNIK